MLCFITIWIGVRFVFHVLPANIETVHWGFFDSDLRPAILVNSGDFIQVETITHHAGDAPDLLMDPAIMDIYQQTPEETRSPGPHILTGPIYVEDAKPGDMLEVEILRLEPRIPFGSNLTASWGYLYKEFEESERVTIYEIDNQGTWLSAKFSYDYPGKYLIPGRIIGPGSIERTPALKGIQIPARLHIGTMGVAPASKGRLSTVPPGKHGGNIDNWRITAGTTMYYPVLVEGALLSLGDSHLAQGDSELSGTAIEASLNCLIRLTVRKDMNFSSPLLETATSWVTHGFDSDLNVATRLASLEMLKFLTDVKHLSKNDAYSLMSVATDYSITQVVDEQQGVHVSIPKNIWMTRE